MELQLLSDAFSVAKLDSAEEVDFRHAFTFVSQTDDELSLVCPTHRVPKKAIAREDDWRGLKIMGMLNFSILGVIARIADILCREGISIFVVSTYNTDYLFIKAVHLDAGVSALSRQGYQILS